jgi:hypothetical protein
MSASDNPTVQLLAHWLELVVEMYAVDLEALPEDALFDSIGGKVRTPHQITAEVAMMMNWMSRTLAGETVPSPTDADQTQFMDAAKSKAALIQLIHDCGAEFKSALLLATPEQFEEEVDTPFGGQRKVIVLANIYINHIWYHDGQLNVIQAFLGDSEVHW